MTACMYSNTIIQWTKMLRIFNVRMIGLELYHLYIEWWSFLFLIHIHSYQVQSSWESSKVNAWCILYSIWSSPFKIISIFFQSFLVLKFKTVYEVITFILLYDDIWYFFVSLEIRPIFIDVHGEVYSIQHYMIKFVRSVVISGHLPQ
jgi:hypothetical protein